VVAVEDLSLTVPKGAMFGFLGPNGSGKSTTIGCLTGLLDPSGGEMEILGERFTAESVGLKRRMGVMPESLGLFEPLYAHEFLAFVGRMFGLDETTTRARVTELLAALELTDSSKTLAEYSTGMRKRVAFAAAVIHAPEVLFLDEPFESIDPAGVALMKQWLRRFTEQAARYSSPVTCSRRWSGYAARWPSSRVPANWSGRATSRCWPRMAQSNTTGNSSAPWSRCSCA